MDVLIAMFIVAVVTQAVVNVILFISLYNVAEASKANSRGIEDLGQASKIGSETLGRVITRVNNLELRR